MTYSCFLTIVRGAGVGDLFLRDAVDTAQVLHLALCVHAGNAHILYRCYCFVAYSPVDTDGFADYYVLLAVIE